MRFTSSSTCGHSVIRLPLASPSMRPRSSPAVSPESTRMIRCRRCREVQGSSTVALAEREPATQVGAAAHLPDQNADGPIGQRPGRPARSPEGVRRGCVEVTAETTLTTEPGELRTPQNRRARAAGSQRPGHRPQASAAATSGSARSSSRRSPAQTAVGRPRPHRDELDNDGRCGPVADA